MSDSQIIESDTEKLGTNVSVVIKSSSVNVDLQPLKSTTLNLTSNSPTEM